jgi:hypothetical protein
MASRVVSNLPANPGSPTPWQGCRHPTQAHRRRPARQGIARPAVNLQCGVRRTASLDIAAPAACQATL